MDILDKVQRSLGKSGRALDVAVLDICYHKDSMDSFINTRIKKCTGASPNR